MIIVVDAYNVLKRETGTPDISHQQRIAFLSQIAHYNKQKGHEMIIVFDGGESSWPSVTKQRHLTVVYSGNQRTADDYIRSYLTHHAHKDIILVSSDNELNFWADRHDIPSIDSDVFYTKLRQTVQVNGPSKKENRGALIKTSSSADAFLDEVMRESAVQIQHKVEDFGGEKELEKSAGSKKDKKLLRIMNKL